MLTLQLKRCNVVGIVASNGERFIYMFDNESWTELLATLGRHAADPQLSFSWYEAAVLSKAARRLKEKQR